MIVAEYVSLFELWLGLHPISEECRASLSRSIGELREAFLRRQEQAIDIGGGNHVLLNEQVDQLIDQSKGDVADSVIVGDRRGH